MRGLCSVGRHRRDGRLIEVDLIESFASVCAWVLGFERVSSGARFMHKLWADFACNAGTAAGSRHQRHTLSQGRWFYAATSRRNCVTATDDRKHRGISVSGALLYSQFTRSLRTVRQSEVVHTLYSLAPPLLLVLLLVVADRVIDTNEISVNYAALRHALELYIYLFRIHSHK